MAPSDTLLLDADLRVVALTPGAARGLGLPSDAVGCDLAEAGPPALAAEAQAALGGEAVAPREVERADGGWARISVRPLPGVGVAVTVDDVTAQRACERALRRRQSEFEALAEVTAQMVWKGGPDGAIVEDSPAWRAFTGQSLESWLEGRLDEVIHPDDLAAVAAVAPVEGEEPSEFDIRFRLWHAESGAWRWVRARGVPLFDDDGAFLGHLGLTTDIHDAHTATEALRASERRFRALVDASSDYVWRTDAEGKTLDRRPWAEFTGLSAEVAEDEGWHVAVHPDDREAVQREMAEAFAARTRYEATYRLLHGETGTYRWVTSRGVPVWGADGAFEGFVGTHRDVTDEREAAAAVEASERRFRALVDAASEMVFETEPDGGIRPDIPEWEALTGQTPDEYGGRGWFAAVHPDDRERMSAAFHRAAATAAPLDEEFRVRAVDGTWRWLAARATPLLGADGALEGYVGMNTDVTERREAAEAVAARERRFRALVEASSDVVWETGADGRWLGDTPTWQAFTGQTQEEGADGGWFDAIHPDDQAVLAERWAALRAGGPADLGDAEATFRIWHAPSESWRWVTSRWAAVWAPDGTFEGYVGMNRDVTDERAAAAAVEASERRFRALVEASSEMVWETDADGAILPGADGWAAFTGQSEAEYLGYGWVAAVHPDDVEGAVGALTAAIEARAPIEHEFRARRADGTYRWLLARAAPILGADGALEGYVGMNTDVTERREAAEAIEVRERRFRALVEASAEVVWQTDATGEWADGSPTWLAFTGQTPDEAEGLGWIDAVHPDDRPDLAEAWAALRAAPPSDIGESETTYRLWHAASESWRWVVVRWAAVWAPDGTFEGYVGMNRDVTEEREAADALRESERRFRSLVEVTSVMVWETDAEGRTRGDSPSWRAFTGMTHEAWRAGRWLDAVHPDDQAALAEAWDVAMAGGGLFDHEFRVRRVDGAWRWVAGRGAPLFGPDGEVEGYIGMTADVHERRTAAEALIVSGRRFETLVDVTSEIIWESDPTGSPIRDTRPWQRFTGQTEAEVAGVGWIDAVHPDDRAALLATWDHPDGPQGIDFRLRRADGAWRWVSGRIAPVYGLDGAIESYIGMNVDITEEREAAEALRDSERRFRTLVEVASEIVWEADPEGVPRGDSPSWRRFTGQSAEDWAAGLWPEAIHPDDREAVLEAYREAVASGAPFRREFRVRRADGAYRWMLGRAAPLYDAAGAVEGYIGMNSDVTERLEAAEALRHSERRFRTLVDVSSEIVWESAIDGGTVGDTSSWRRFTGQTEAEMAGLGWLAVVHPDDRDQLTGSWDHSFAKGRPHVQEFRLRRADGAWRWMAARGAPIYGADGEIESYIGMNVDVTEERQAAEAVRESEARFRALVEASSSIVWLADTEGTLIDDGTTWEAFTGQTTADLAPGERFEMVHPDDRPALLERWRAIFEGGPEAAAQTEVVFRLWHAPSGSWRWVTTRATPLYGPDGAVAGYIGMAADVTEEREAAEAVRASERRFRALVEASAGIVWEADASGELCDDGQTWTAFTGQTLAERDERWLDVVHPEDRDYVVDMLRTAREGDPTVAPDVVATFRIRHAPSASWRWVISRSIPVLGTDGAIEGYVGMTIDVTEQREAAEAVRLSERRFRALIEASAEIVWEADADGEWTDDAATWTAFTGQSREARAHTGWLEVVHPDDRAGLVAMWKSIRDGRPDDALEASATFRLWHAASETWRWMTTRGAPLVGADGAVEGYVGMNIDVTERHEAVEALRESEARFRAMADTVPGVLFTVEPTGEISFISLSFADNTGVDPAEFKRPRDWAAVVHPDDWEPSRAAWKAAVAGGKAFESRFRMRDDSGAYRWTIARARPVRTGEAGTRWVGTALDIEDLVAAERALQEANETLEARVEAGTARIRELAAALATAEQAERRRIAQVIHDDLQQQQYGLAILLSQARHAAAPPTAALLERCERIVEEATAIGRGLVAELRPSVLDSDDIGDLLDWLASESKRLHGLEVAVQVDGPSRVPDAQARAIAHQVIREALFNVVKHAGVPEAHVRAHVEGGRLVAEVEDRGDGFDPAERAEGFGLSSIRDRLALSGGAVEVDSAPGRGTCVRISIPAE